MRRLYFDYNASAPLRPEAAAAMREVDALAGNPSSVHAEGRALRVRIEDARDRVRRALDAGDARVVWTSGATEADNLAIFGLARAGAARGVRTLVLSGIEHAAVRGPADRLEREGWRVERIAPDPDGFVDPARFSAAAKGAEAIASCIFASNEVGSVQDVRAIARDAALVVHTDATQAVGRIPFSFRETGVAVATVSSHKLGGPRGVGALVIRGDVEVEPMFSGGDQEYGLRAGTEAAPSIVGFAVALEHAVRERAEAASRLRELTTRLRAGIEVIVPRARFATPATRALPNTLAVTIPGLDGRALVVALDLAGIAASVGSACASGAIEPSAVLLAMGRTPAEARSTVRFSLGAALGEDDVDELLRRLARVVEGATQEF
ncbi:MAG TPA: cysteine desulfurase family protein [Planctomycetota bacterium]|nr:cysteine desulfurase family protein [Planctomycetota bacterium]